MDEKYFTSSGVSAGMDMTLGFLSVLHGIEFARQIAFNIVFIVYKNHPLHYFAANYIQY